MTDDPSRQTITLTRSSVAGATSGPPDEVEIPRKLGSVRLIREIGRGGMGVVYLGRHEMLGRDVAVKFLLHAVAGPDDPGFARFLEGARAAATVRHAGLTAVHDADLVDGVPYLVMEYIDGPTLSDLLKGAGPLDAAVAVAVLDDVLDSLAALHDQGIIHRDIKPSNILLHRDGRVLLTDFGLACARPGGQRGPSTAGVGGSPAYMAPEMFDGEVSPRSDVYALGITGFELLCGTLPFSGMLEEVRAKHAQAPLPVDVLQQRAVEPALIDVLERATHKNAMFRYKSAGFFQQALRGVTASAEARNAGRAALRKLILTFASGQSSAQAAPAVEKTPTSTYFNRLTELARERRSESPDAPSPGEAPGADNSTPAPVKAVEVTEDLLCIRCGYNLRGLRFDRQCPECGTAVERSRHGNLLAAADADWLAGVCRGVTLIGAAAVTVFVVFLALFISATFLLSVWPTGIGLLFRPSQILLAVAGFVLLWGVVRVTRADPRLALAEQPIVLRRITRGATIAALCFMVMLRVFENVPAPAVLTAISRWGYEGTLLFSVVAAAYYLAHLGERIPDPKLARSTRSTARAFAVCAVLTFGTISLVRSGSQPTSGTLFNLQVLAGIFTLVWIVTALWLLVQISRYPRALRPCLVEARERDRAARLTSAVQATEDDRMSTPMRAGSTSSAAQDTVPRDSGLTDVILDGWLARTRLRNLPGAILLVAGAGSVLVLAIIGLARLGQTRGWSPLWVAGYWIGVMLLAAAVYLLLQRRVRHRVRAIVETLPKADVDAVAFQVLRRAFRRHNPAMPVALVKELARKKQLGRTFRACPASHATPVDPISVPFEPITLDEADPSFVGLALTGTPSDAQSTRPQANANETENLGVRRVKRNILMRGGWGQVLIFGTLFAFSIFRAIQRRRIDFPLILWGTGFAFFFLEPAGWLRSMRKQWLLVPAGLVVRKVRGLKRNWELHLFERRKSVLCAYRYDKRRWQLIVGDADGRESTVATKAEIELLLAAWLSPLEPPPPERLTDLG